MIMIRREKWRGARVSFYPPTTHGKQERNRNRCLELALGINGQTVVMLDWFG